LTGGPDFAWLIRAWCRKPFREANALQEPQLAQPAEDHEEYHDDIIYPGTIPFILVHLVCFAAIWTGVTAQAVAICIALYFIRMFAATGIYHRYFSHRTYKTSRVGQFLLAILAQSTAQRGVLWWAAKHRHHHRFSDMPEDVHSPRHRGFWYAHVGWIFSRREEHTDYSSISDLTKYPELVWLDKHQYLVPALLAIGVFLVAGWPGLVVGFFWSTVILFHCTFFINSLAHVHGKQRYLTGDDSRNNWWLALITMGEGWHNNHHAYQSSTRQGFRWYEVDITYYILKALSWTGFIWDLRDPPPEVVRGERAAGRAVVEKVARQLAASFPIEKLSAQLRDVHAHAPGLAELRERVRAAGGRAEHLLSELQLHIPHMPHLPTVDEIRSRALEMYAQSPSLDEVVERAREILIQTVLALALDEPLPQTA
jgi:stearoyl-CoA desaturase (delta-9 desaturase)